MKSSRMEKGSGERKREAVSKGVGGMRRVVTKGGKVRVAVKDREKKGAVI